MTESDDREEPYDANKELGYPGRNQGPQDFLIPAGQFPAVEKAERKKSPRRSGGKWHRDPTEDPVEHRPEFTPYEQAEIDAAYANARAIIAAEQNNPPSNTKPAEVPLDPETIAANDRNAILAEMARQALADARNAARKKK